MLSMAYKWMWGGSCCCVWSRVKAKWHDRWAYAFMCGESVVDHNRALRECKAKVHLYDASYCATFEDDGL